MTFFAPPARLIVIPGALNPCNNSARFGFAPRHEQQRLFLGPAGLDFRARPDASAPRRIIRTETGRGRTDRIVRGVAVRSRRGLRYRDGARGSRPLPPSRRGEPALVLRNPGPQVRPGPREA